MSLPLRRSSAFVRAARKAVKKDPQLESALRQSLQILQQDVFDPRLHSHKLSGPLEGSWAAAVTYDWRIVFSFVEDNGHQGVLLESFGTHDHVY